MSDLSYAARNEGEKKCDNAEMDRKNGLDGLKIHVSAFYPAPHHKNRVKSHVGTTSAWGFLFLGIL